MKILFLTPRDSKKYLGGVEGHVRLLTEELERRGHEVRELSLSEVGAPVVRSPLPWSTSTRRGVATTGFGRSGDILSQAPKYRDRPKMLWKIEAWVMLWKNKSLFKLADIIHVHDVFWWVMPFAIMNRLSQLPQYYVYLFPWSTSMRHKSASTGYGRTSDFFQRKKSGPSVFATFHGWEGVCPPTRSAVWQKRAAAFLSNGTIGVGNFFEKWYGVKTDRVVWGVNTIINKGPAFRLAKGRALRQIVFLGRLEEVNGVEILLEALKVGPWRTLRSDLFRFVFVGDGSYRKQAEKYGLVTGMVKNPQKYLADADVVITSSYMSMLEAAAMGKPVIAIANSELKEDYLHCHPLRKYIKVARNADELVSIIRGLYKGPALREQQGRALNDLEDAKVWAKKQTPEKLADVYEELWKKK